MYYGIPRKSLLPCQLLTDFHHSKMCRFLFVFSCSRFSQYAIKLATKLNEKRLSSITELTTLEDKPIIVDTGQRDKDRDKDSRDRERDWTYQKQNHKTNNHQQSVVNHSTNVSCFFFYSFISLVAFHFYYYYCIPCFEY